MTQLDSDPRTGEIELRSSYLPASPAEAKRAMAAYQELCAAVLTPEDWIGRPGEPESFVKKSGWDTLATFYGASVELIGDTKLERDADGNLTRASARARAIGRDGRHRDGGGACGRNEPRFAIARGRQKIEHDLPATAETRATNRAIANLIGFGAVSAEEVDADVRAGAASERALPDWAADIPDDAAERVARNLELVFAAAGDENPDLAALNVGRKLAAYCDGTFPAACARLAHLLAQATNPKPPVSDDEADGDAVDEPPGAQPDYPTDDPRGDQA